jgi:multidrug efflux pump subunit AcrA (membrane-fusion protein)
MEVLALLNESVVTDVRSGMRARVRVEGMPDQTMWGQVTKLGQFPVSDWRVDARYFEGIVKLDAPIAGLKPGMTAQVELEMPEREDVLTVPSEAITTTDDGNDVCFVVQGDGLEKRPVKLGQVTESLSEVTAGLREGEQVVLNPHPQEGDELEAPESAPAASSVASTQAEPAAGEVAAGQ